MVRLVITLVLILAAGEASAEWVRVDAPHFVVFGEIGEKRTREYAAEFERLREALGRVVPGAAARPAAPAVVFIFKDARTFEPYRPFYNGKPVEVSGYFAGGPSLDVIMLPATNREAALRTIYHEYSHLITVNMARGLPPWLSEGLAEYYSTFEVRDDGRSALLGGVILPHLARLNDTGLIPLDQLLTVEQDSPLYNEGSRRSTFYAQSWALVHMLLNGEPDRTTQFNDYVRLAAAGRPPLEAWREVFGEEKILEQLRRYVRQALMKGYLFKFDRAIAPAAFSVSVPPAADVHAALGDLRLHVSPETVAAHMERSPAPPTPFTAAIQGLIRVEANDFEGALPLLLQATRESTDWLVRYRAAVGLERLATAARDDLSRSAGQAADAALRDVLERRPDLAHAVALRALVAGPGDQGMELIRRARQLAPGRTHYAIWQAQYHSTRGEFAEARALLAPLMSSWFPQETRDYARKVMGDAVDAEKARLRAAETRAMSGRVPAGPGAVIPLVRQVGQGEERIEAEFDRIECPRAGLVVHVLVEGRPARYTAPSFDAVEFLSYRGEMGPVHCGPRLPRDKVYLTWRRSADPSALDGVVVAIEFLPR